MSGRWFGGLQVRGLDKGQTPVSDLYCVACGHHERRTGRTKVGEYLRANPLNEHRAKCKPKTS